MNARARNERTPSTLRPASPAALLRRYNRTRDPGDRADLCAMFDPLARGLARRYGHARENAEDVQQVARLGLLKAIDGFEPDRGKPFEAYAVPTILGEIRRFFRDRIWTVRLPRSLSELAIKVEAATEQTTDELGRAPTPAELAERLGVSTEDVLETLTGASARRIRSLDAPLPGAEREATTLLNTIGTLDPGYERVETNAAVAAANLSEPELQSLKLRFEEGLTQREAGEVMGYSQMQISRLSRSGLQKLLDAASTNDG